MQLAPEQSRSSVPQRLLALVRKELIRPSTGDAAGRRRLPVPAPADPRRRLRRAAEGDARRPARAVRALARRARLARRAGRDRRLSPRAGGPLPAELGSGERSLSHPRPPSGSSARPACRNERGDVVPQTISRDRAVDLLPPGNPTATRHPSFPRPACARHRAVASVAEADRRAGGVRINPDRALTAYSSATEAEMREASSRMSKACGRRADEAVTTFTGVGDERGIAHAERIRGYALWMNCKAEEARAAFAHVLEHAERAGEPAPGERDDDADLARAPSSDRCRCPRRSRCGEAHPRRRGQASGRGPAKRGLGRMLTLVGRVRSGS